MKFFMMRNLIILIILISSSSTINSQTNEGSFTIGFNSKSAIDFSNQIIKEHWKNYNESVSRFYGRVWLDNYAKHQFLGEKSFYDDYLQELSNRNMQKIRMDCTIYCAKVLKAGMGTDEYSKLVKYHNEIWPGDGFAGWSVGHLLVDKFGWKAYAFIEPGAGYYHHYFSHFKDKREYPVWRQPNIKIEAYYSLGQDNAEIEELLSKYKFSWGFSQDGIHTWITSYTDLLECRWDGPPAARYNSDEWLPDLFITTRFIRYKDYDVHIIVVPPED